MVSLRVNRHADELTNHQSCTSALRERQAVSLRLEVSLVPG